VKNNLNKHPYKHVVLGGSFDHLHQGHKKLLHTAFFYGEKVHIGITAQEVLLKKKYTRDAQPLETRINQLKNFLQKHNYLDRAEIFVINTVEGGADIRPELEAIIVSDDDHVIANAKYINEKRLENGLKRLIIIVVPRVLTKDGKPISSTRIRRGEHFKDSDLIFD